MTRRYLFIILLLLSAAVILAYSAVEWHSNSAAAIPRIESGGLGFTESKWDSAHGPGRNAYSIVAYYALPLDPSATVIFLATRAPERLVRQIEMRPHVQERSLDDGRIAVRELLPLDATFSHSVRRDGTRAGSELTEYWESSELRSLAMAVCRRGWTTDPSFGQPLVIYRSDLNTGKLTMVTLYWDCPTG